MDVTALGLLAVRAFVVVTMASFGLQIAGSQLAAVLGRPRLVIAALVANLVVVPLVGVVLAIALGLPDAVAIGLIVTACSAGSSYSAKLVEIAGGDIRVGIGLMFLLAAVTAVVLGPLAAVMLGLLGSARGVQVSLDPMPILVTLVLFQLLPLIGLMELQRRAPGLALRLREPAMRASSVLLVLACVAVLLDSADEVVALGPLPLVAMVALIGAGLLVGHAIGGARTPDQRATALITGQRSASVAYIAVQGVALPVATATVVAFALVMLVVNLGISLTSRRFHLAAGGERLSEPVPNALDQAPG
jgi:BASS family bile acid:Na+ symporter